VLFDPQALTREDVTAVGEQRHVAIGLDAVGRVLVVALALRGDTVRRPESDASREENL
jgi:uncharacterized DUF497 family protein